VREERALGAPAESAGSGTSGRGRVLVAVYGTFALAAGARAAVQIATRFSEAPIAYLLSALAAVVYIVATVGLARGPRGRRMALAAITVELVGVLVVGTLSLADPAAFPDATVWSAYGRGYYFVPLVLPVLGLLQLRSARQEPAQKSPPPKSPPPKSPPP
jgi:cytochrome bd-type quinol oxidase subunit 2